MSESINLQLPVELAVLEQENVEQTVSHYFASLNQADFATTAGLFAPTGVLYPPFESAIVGREAILSYLQTEAKGLQLAPVEQAIELVDDQIQVKVTGTVQTPLLKVNVAWKFILNAEGEILSVKIKLLAALEELLHLKM